MGALVAYGALTAISIVIGVVMLVISLFVGHIILFDSIFLALLSGVLCHEFLGLHPAFALLLGIAVFSLLFWLQNTKFGFWIIGILLSALWGFIFGFIAYAFTSQDMIWFYVVWGLGTAVMIGLHLKARDE